MGLGFPQADELAVAGLPVSEDIDATPTGNRFEDRYEVVIERRQFLEGGGAELGGRDGGKHGVLLGKGRRQGAAYQDSQRYGCGSGQPEPRYSRAGLRVFLPQEPDG